MLIKIEKLYIAFGHKTLYLRSMQQLNLPAYEFRLENKSGVTFIFDEVRKKFIALTPEEWVRQNFIRFLRAERRTPASLLAIETSLKYNTLRKRADILIYDKLGKPWMLIECKAPEVRVSQDTFDQAARYNMTFRVRYLVVTNGLQHFCCEMDYKQNSFCYLPDIPFFS